VTAEHPSQLNPLLSTKQLTPSKQKEKKGWTKQHTRHATVQHMDGIVSAHKTQAKVQHNAAQ